MSNPNQRFFSNIDEIKVFIKGNKYYYGYCIFQDDLRNFTAINVTDFDINESEFTALNEAMKAIKIKFPTCNKITIYSNNETVTLIVKKINTPCTLKPLYEEFKALSKNRHVSIDWVPSINGKSRKSSQLEAPELEFAQKKLFSLSAKIKEYKRNAPHLKK